MNTETKKWKQIAIEALSGDENLVYNAWVKANLGDTLLELQSIRSVLLLCEGKPCVEGLNAIIDRINRIYNPPKF